jgi:hypothetical protein
MHKGMEVRKSKHDPETLAAERLLRKVGSLTFQVVCLNILTCLKVSQEISINDLIVSLQDNGNTKSYNPNEMHPK